MLRSVVCLLLIALGGCVTAPQTRTILAADEAQRSAVLLDNVPFFPQEQYQCGPAALATVLHHGGVAVDADALVPLVYVPARQGSLQVEMLAAARHHGRIPFALDGQLASLLDEVSAGRPVLVMQNLGLSWHPQWHYAVVVGFDLQQRQLTLRSATIREHRVSLATFERTWARAEHWAVVVLQAGQLPVQADEFDYVAAVAAFERLHAQQAVAAYVAGYQRWPSMLSAMALANAHYGAGQLTAAAVVLQELLVTDPDYAPAHNNLAHIMLASGNADAACHHARKAVTLTAGYGHQATLQRVQESVGVCTYSNSN